MNIVNKIKKRSDNITSKIVQSVMDNKSLTKSVKVVKQVSGGLIIAVGNSRFWVHGGEALSHLKDLERALISMSEAQYLYHVSKAKNDFAKWTEEVLKDKKTAELLSSAKSKTEAVKVVTKSLLKYK